MRPGEALMGMVKGWGAGLGGSNQQGGGKTTAAVPAQLM